MTDIYELWDHRCPELEILLKEKKVRFQGFACWCSPMERTYQVFEDEEWKSIRDCPFCGESMTGLSIIGMSIMQPTLYIEPNFDERQTLQRQVEQLIYDSGWVRGDPRVTVQGLAEQIIALVTKGVKRT